MAGGIGCKPKPGYYLSMPRLFGTDGVRGVANTELTPELALSLGRAAAEELGGTAARPKVVLARDTRISGDMLESALAAGLSSAGADVIHAGVLPTPGVAYLVTLLGAAAGAVISASHNPVQDNGIKFFGADGYKLKDEEENKIESLLTGDLQRPVGRDVGRTSICENAADLYIRHALLSLEGRRLDGLKVVLDCANGAAFRTSPAALVAAGAEVIVMNDEPDGTNINEGCGSTFPGPLAERTVAEGANVGLAHDGDADRVIAVDEKGSIIDGDAMIAALSLELKRGGALKDDVVVATVMANLGFRKAMKANGITLIETPVGDRYVIEKMIEIGASIGGEQSGHVIFSEFSTTGDGLITALRLLGLMVSSGEPLSQLASVVTRFPQVLLNVRVADKHRFASSAKIKDAIAAGERRVGEDGRVLVRASGTEPLVRVMVEAAQEPEANGIAAEIASVIERELGVGGA